MNKNYSMALLWSLLKHEDILPNWEQLSKCKASNWLTYWYIDLFISRQLEFRVDLPNNSDKQKLSTSIVERLAINISNYKKHILIGACFLGVAAFAINKYRRLIASYFTKHLNNKNEEPLSQPFAKQAKKSKFLFTGQTGSGKSSLLNKLLNLNRQTGIGGCTRGIVCVAESNQYEIYDSEGVQNSIFTDIQSTKLQEYMKYEQIAVTYESSLKSIDKLVKKFSLTSETLNIIFIRTKCDLFSAAHKHSLEEEIEKDRNLLIEWGYKPSSINIFTTTATNRKSPLNIDLIKYTKFDSIKITKVYDESATQSNTRQIFEFNRSQ